MKEFFEARFQALKEYLSSITEGFSTIGIITEIIDIILVIALIVFIIYSCYLMRIRNKVFGF